VFGLEGIIFLIVNRQRAAVIQSV